MAGEVAAESASVLKRRNGMRPGKKQVRLAAKANRILSEMKVCRACKEEKPKTLEFFYKSKVNEDGFNNACKPCVLKESNTRRESTREKNKAQAVAWQKANPEKRRAYMQQYKAEYEQLNPNKKLAQLAVAYAVKTGKLIKKPCEICNKPDTEAHHPSYEPENFLWVQWLCGKHHYRANRMPGPVKYYGKVIDSQYEDG